MTLDQHIENRVADLIAQLLPGVILDMQVTMLAMTPEACAAMGEAWAPDRVLVVHESSGSEKLAPPHVQVRRTFDEFHAILDNHRSLMVEGMKQDIQEQLDRASPAVTNTIMNDAGLVTELVEKWPIYNLPGWTWAVWLALWLAPTAGAGRRRRFGETWWTPPNATSLQIAEWAVQNRLLPASRVSEVKKHGDLPHDGLGVLWALEQRAITLFGRPWELLPIPTSKTSVGALNALGHVKTTALAADATIRGDGLDGETVHIRFKSTGDTLELPLYGDASATTGLLLELGKKYGPTLTRDALALLAHAWAARVNPGDTWWVWPTEILDMTERKSTNKDAVRAIRKQMEILSTAELTVTREGRSTTGPVLSILEENTGGGKGALRVAWHTALYEDIARSSGVAGSAWWRVPFGLLGLGLSHGRRLNVHGGALVLAQQWRAQWGRTKRTTDPHELQKLVARIKLSRLADYTNFPQNRQIDAAESMGEELKRVGFVRSFQLDKRSSGDPVVVALPAASTLEHIANGHMPMRPAWVPSTGTELRQWMTEHCLTAKDVGDRTGSSAAAVHKWYRTDLHPLKPRAREALVRWLRPPLK